MARKRLKVAACQMSTGEDVERNAACVVERLEACAAQDVHVAAFPEGVLYGYSCREAFWRRLRPGRLERAEARIVRACRRLHIAAVVGTSHVAGGKRLNSLLVVDRDGAVRGRYSKTHLAGERWCVPGVDLPVYRLCGVSCCFLICHDIRYPELVRLPAAAGAQVCFFCSCESSVLEEWKLSAYRAMPISRATENGIYVVMANAAADPADLHRSGCSHGQSKVIHPDGNVMAEAGVFTEETVVCNLDLTRATGAIARRAVGDATRLRSWMQAGVALVQARPAQA